MYHRCRNCNGAVEVIGEITPHKNFRKSKKQCECGKPSLTRAERNRVIRSPIEVYRSDGKDWVLSKDKKHFIPYKSNNN